MNPTIPQKLLGIRIEPPPSLPNASGLMPIAIATADPPLEPQTFDRWTTDSGSFRTLRCALWRYVERSVDYLFGDASGDPVENTIMRPVKATEGLIRTQIRDLFGRHETVDRISQALGRLLADGRART